MVDFTVAIRTYNGEKNLPKVLEGLKAQVNTEGIDWEVVIVDNNSTDNTAQIVQAYQASWNQNCLLKYYFEPKQGAAIARRRAIRESQGMLIGFLDDDNVPDANWVAAAYAFAQTHPKAGAYAGEIHGDFEVTPPKNFKKIAHFLPVIERRKTICYTDYEQSHRRVLPPGAGLVIRKQAWVDHVPEKLVLQGPVGKSLAAKGEDIEALHYIRSAGWEIWHNAEMHIYHQIPEWRFEKAYLVKFFHGIGLSRHRTRMLGFKLWQRPFMFPFYMVNDLRKFILYSIKYRNILETDVVAACELELLRSSLISPFYIWKRQVFS